MWARALTGADSRVGTSISARSLRNSPPTMYQTSTGHAGLLRRDRFLEHQALRAAATEALNGDRYGGGGAWLPTSGK